MSGDVFGNGMLLSRQIRLVAAFDHRDIFIDPIPTRRGAMAERKRLFELPRSSWQDYDRSQLIGRRRHLLPQREIDNAFDRDASLRARNRSVTANELMTAILKAPVDLFWFGGIGTYVRGGGETTCRSATVPTTPSGSPRRTAGQSDRGREPISPLRSGAASSLRSLGGRINTDAIDNSAGVNTSDVEVNIKIALGAAEAPGKLDMRRATSFSPR